MSLASRLRLRLSGGNRELGTDQRLHGGCLDGAEDLGQASDGARELAAVALGKLAVERLDQERLEGGELARKRFTSASGSRSAASDRRTLEGGRGEPELARRARVGEEAEDLGDQWRGLVGDPSERKVVDLFEGAALDDLEQPVLGEALPGGRRPGDLGAW